MTFSFNSLLKKCPCWMQSTAAGEGIVLTSVVRVVRNLPGYRFPGWSTEADRSSVAKKLLPALKSYPELRSCYRAEMSELSHEQRLILLERKQITPCMAARQNGCHLLISRNQKLIAMVNEEEHLCLHIGVPGFDISAAMKGAMDVSRHLESKLQFAASGAGGYKTSMPQEAGDGLQLFAMLHLPALALAGQLDRVRHALEQLHLNLSAFCSESEDLGNLFILYSNAVPCGESVSFVEHFSHVCETLIRKEQRMAHREFMSNDGPDLVDRVYRAYAILRYSHSLGYKELLGALSMVRWGLQLHLLLCKGDNDADIVAPDNLMRLYALSPACLRLDNAEISTALQACMYRSKLVRKALDSFIPYLVQ